MAADKNTDQNDVSLPMIIRAQYIKDLSFENPNPLSAFNSLANNNQPNINVDIQVKGHNLGQNNFEVVLEIRAEAKREKETLFMIELHYAGIISIGEVPEEVVAPLVMIECPHILFPFARNILADVTRDGGFPPLFLAPIDFAILYSQQHGDTPGKEAAKEEPKADKDKKKSATTH